MKYPNLAGTILLLALFLGACASTATDADNTSGVAGAVVVIIALMALLLWKRRT